MQSLGKLAVICVTVVLMVQVVNPRPTRLYKSGVSPLDCLGNKKAKRLRNALFKNLVVV
jgi:hypothetical protein